MLHPPRFSLDVSLFFPLCGISYSWMAFPAGFFKENMIIVIFSLWRQGSFSRVSVDPRCLTAESIAKKANIQYLSEFNFMWH
jgi:hypothetical protein